MGAGTVVVCLIVESERVEVDAQMLSRDLIAGYTQPQPLVVLASSARRPRCTATTLRDWLASSQPCQDKIAYDFSSFSTQQAEVFCFFIVHQFNLLFSLRSHIFHYAFRPSKCLPNPPPSAYEVEFSTPSRWHPRSEQQSSQCRG